jgi:hypothetical protein
MFHKIRTSFWLFCAVLSTTQGGVALAAIDWRGPAQYHRLLKKPVPGVLSIDETGVEFRSPGFSYKWPFPEIRTFDLSGARELTITGYENRHWHEPGERTYRFTLSLPMPPVIAAELAARVERPVINGDPYPAAKVIAEIPAHRRERFGGSNGTLRLRDDGIDYVTADGRDGRSWRWSDIQTLANPNPWDLRVTAYREIVEFDLKQPLEPRLFDRLWESLYASDPWSTALNITAKEGHHQ